MSRDFAPLPDLARFLTLDRTFIKPILYSQLTIPCNPTRSRDESRGFGSSAISIAVMRFVAALLAAAPLVNQAHGLRGAPCFEACQMVLHPIKFNDTAGLSPSPPTRQCQSHKGLASLYLCAQVFCSVEERTAGLQFLSGTCHNKVNESIPSFDLIANYTDDKISHLDRFEKQDWIDGTTFQDALLPSDVFFGQAYDTLV